MKTSLIKCLLLGKKHWVTTYQNLLSSFVSIVCYNFFLRTTLTL